MSQTCFLLSRVTVGCVGTLAIVVMLFGNAAVPKAHAGGASEPGYSQCITFDTTSNNLTAFMLNHCNMQLFVKWTDSGDCRNWKCGIPIGPNGKESIGSLKSGVQVAACRYPIDPRITASGRYDCFPL
jgi:hypothetical protein